MNLFIKLHPSYIVWLIDSENYGFINLNSNLIDNGRIIYKQLSEQVSSYYPRQIIIEKPFLKLLGDNNRKLADTIIHVQRNFGVMLFILDWLFPEATTTHVSPKEARRTVYKADQISKDIQLSEVNALLKGIKNKDYPPLILLGLHDLLVMKTFNERK